MKNSIFQLVFLIIIFGLSLPASQNAQAAASYRINNTASQVIDEWGSCSTVTNNTGDDIFIPTNTAAEWTSFRNNAPAGITFACCSGSTNVTANGSFTLGAGCTTLTIEAWGGGGGGGVKSSGTAKPGGAGGYAKKTITGATPGTVYTVTIGNGGACNRTAGTGGYSGGLGGNSNACVAGAAGGGTGTGGNGGTKVGAGCVGGAGKYGGGGGGGAAQSTMKGAGGGGATLVEVGTQDIVIAGGGGGAGAGDQGTAGAGGAACALVGGNGSGGDASGGGGGGACACWDGATLSAANCTSTANGTGATAPTPNPGAGYVIGGPATTGACSGTTNDGKPGYVTFTYSD